MLQKANSKITMGHVTKNSDIKGEVTTPNLLNVIDIKEICHRILELVY